MCICFINWVVKFVFMCVYYLNLRHYLIFDIKIVFLHQIVKYISKDKIVIISIVERTFVLKLQRLKLASLIQIMKLGIVLKLKFHRNQRPNFLQWTSDLSLHLFKSIWITALTFSSDQIGPFDKSKSSKVNLFTLKFIRYQEI